MDHAAVASKHRAVEVDDLARRLGLGPQPLDQAGVIAVGHEADVLAVELGGDLELQLGGERTNIVLG